MQRLAWPQLSPQLVNYLISLLEYFALRLI